MEKISIVIPIYNVERYLPQCLDSLLLQSETRWEAILVDDGSTDSSGKICDEYSARDSRFRAIHQKNGGAASAKNTGLDLADGDYIAFIDSDDYVEPHWLETLIVTAETWNADVIEFNFDKVYRTHSEPVNSFEEPLHRFTGETYLAQYLSNWTCSLFCNKLFRSKLVQEVRFRRERRCIDDEFFTYKALSGAKTVIRIRDILYHYRQRATSAVSSTKNQLQITEDALEVLIERYEWVCSRFPALRQVYLTHDINILFYFANFFHNSETAKKFRVVARYYLTQVLRHGADRKTSINAVRLQLVSNRKLLKNREKDTAEPDRSRYFE